METKIREAKLYVRGLADAEQQRFAWHYLIYRVSGKLVDKTRAELGFAQAGRIRTRISNILKA